MKTLITTLLLVIMISVSYGQDSVVCFTKKESLTIVNKIRLLQDSLVYSKTVITNQDSLIDKYKGRVSLFQEQLNNRNETIELYKNQSELMKKTIDDLQPKWYDNKFFWFTGGFVVAIVTAVVVN